MPVIGRLDQQVDEVLIGPVARRGRGGETRPRADEQPAPAAGEPPPADRGPAPEPGHESSHQPSAETESRDRAGELPVWML
ncbi:MAG TPA: hypothetical protein VEY09_19620 [Pyrinomonadaceae bacterium]|nr:hypothetical protein [Pyrinomonadaceae bacterium]